MSHIEIGHKFVISHLKPFLITSLIDTFLTQVTSSNMKVLNNLEVSNNLKLSRTQIRLAFRNTKARFGYSRVRASLTSTLLKKKKQLEPS